MNLLPAFAFSALSLFGTGARAIDDGDADGFSWPQWDGPDRSGVSLENDWVSAGREANLWEADLGLGYSTVVVQDGRVFSMGYDREAGLDSVFCFDALTGEPLWSHSYESAIWDRAHEGGTVNTPSIDGDVVFSLNREGNLFCFDAASGEVRWHTYLMGEENEHELEIPTWGFSASPLVLEDQLVLNCGRLVSVDKTTGDVRWTSNDYGHGYGTPVAFERDGMTLVAALNGNGLGVVMAKNGIERDFYEFTGQNRGVNAATPVVMDGSLFISSGKIPADALLAFGEDGLTPVWENREMVNSFSGCVLVDGHLYGFDRSVLKCLDKGGNATWEERGTGNGAVMGAGDRILAMGDSGELIVFKATPEKYEELSRVQLFEEGRYWTKPVLVNGIVYCRSSRGKLVARDHRAQVEEE